LRNLFSASATSWLGVLIALGAIWLVLGALQKYRARLHGLLLAARQKLLAPGVPAPPATTARTESSADGASSGSAPDKARATAAGPAPATSQGTSPDASPSARLHQLNGVLLAFSNSASHPRELAEQKEFKEAVDLLRSPDVPLTSVMQYVLGVNWVLACAALAALEGRADAAGALDDVLAHFDNLDPWAMHFALECFSAAEKRPPVGAPLLRAKDWWAGNVLVPMLLRDYLAERELLGDAPGFGPAAPQPAAFAAIKALLDRVNHPFAIALANELRRLQSETLDRPFLASFGRFWAEEKGLDALVEPAHWREALGAAQALSLDAPGRSLLAAGDPRVGKTSFLKLLARRLAAQGWTVFEASGADLMAGQQWFGQLEGRIQRAVDELAATKKVIWYIPDILQIALSGTHQGQAASILDQILPAIVTGRLMVWTEASPASTARLMRLRPALRSAFEVARLEPLSQSETRELAAALVRAWSNAADTLVDPACADTALDVARQYLSAASLPGAVLDLLKLTIGRATKDGSERVEPSSVILTLSQLTGLPASILDNKERVDLAAVRAYFASRVIGQDEAVTAVVERIAMLKAGLNDPGKPVGVFLFAGPTGTGKTELAKTAAEFLFGSAERLIRLDMSELQTPESTLKVLGGGEVAESDSLISRVRKQPFSVVLLDEFEKAHPNVWDLFLQVFDDGRLTDSLGNVADFRHCLIILTTNLGATSHRGSGLGFAPAGGAYSGDNVMRAIGQTFRPEFQNRLDKVIVFHPLTRDLMRDILKKELKRVLERRGLKDREWAVEWEESALDFLLERGFSPEMGARPLKRAIEQYVIAPLAATIVEKRFPEGDQFVFIRSDGRAVQAEFVDPEGDAGAGGKDAATEEDGDSAEAAPPALPAMILAPEGSAAEVAALEVECDGVEQVFLSQEWEERKGRLADEMQAPDFWSRSDRQETLAQLALMDRVKTAAGTAAALRARLAKGAERSGKSSRELVGRLALQLHLTKEGIRDVLEAAPIEVALLVEPALERQGERAATRAWCEQLIAMYRAWAANRHMQLAELAGAAPHDLPLLLISGFGAHRLLEKEAGLHVLEQPDDAKGRSRATARVRLAVSPLAELPPERLRRALSEALEHGARPHAVVRRYRSEPSPLVRDMTGSWRTGRLDAVLGGNFDLIAASQAAE
jgi:ATP-dependent Clp protease ATP-binding subunit ClpC